MQVIYFVIRQKINYTSSPHYGKKMCALTSSMAPRYFKIGLSLSFPRGINHILCEACCSLLCEGMIDARFERLEMHLSAFFELRWIESFGDVQLYIPLVLNLNYQIGFDVIIRLPVLRAGGAGLHSREKLIVFLLL